MPTSTTRCRPIGHRPAADRAARRRPAAVVDRGRAGSPPTATSRDLPDLLGPGDLVVVNDTRVIPARLHLRGPPAARSRCCCWSPWRRRRTSVGRRWRPAGPPPPAGEVLLGAAGNRPSRWRDRVTDGAAWSTCWSWATASLASDATALGEVPLPPYITEPLADPERYQTVYARRPGSVAAPDGRPPPHARGAGPLGGARRRPGPRRARGRARHLPARDRRRPGRGPPPSTASATACRRRRAGRLPRDPPPADESSRSAPRPCGPSRVGRGPGELEAAPTLFIRRPIAGRSSTCW